MSIWKWADLQVQIGPVNHESWWSHNSGSIAVAIAAIVAAGLAAYVSIRNRQAELDQNRELTDRAHIRDTLDAALETIDRAISTNTDAASLLVFGSSSEDGGESDGDTWNKKVKDLLDALLRIEFSLRSNQVRIEMRMGNDHPVPVAHGQLVGRLCEWADSTESHFRSSEPLSREQATAEVNQIPPAFRAFREACRSWFDSNGQ